MALTAVWVSGSIVRPTRVGPGKLELVNGVPWTDINGEPGKGEAVFRGVGGTTNLFSFPIPTPVILNDNRATLKKVFVFWKADTNVEFFRFFLFDGPKSIGGQGVSLVGPLSFDTNIVMGKNGFDVEPSISMRFGLEILVQINFIDSGDIHFTTAGADFDV